MSMLSFFNVEIYKHEKPKKLVFAAIVSADPRRHTSLPTVDIAFLHVFILW